MKKRKIDFFAIFMGITICMLFLSFPVIGMKLDAKQELIDSIINHPDVQTTIHGSKRVVMKENISGTEYDWRFDIRMIETDGESIAIGHRFHQDSGSRPDSEWVIEYIFVDKWTDGVLDHFDKDRFISISCNDKASWYIVRPYWPDNFNYPLDNTINEEKQKELYDEELKYWRNKLQ